MRARRHAGPESVTRVHGVVLFPTPAMVTSSEPEEIATSPQGIHCEFWTDERVSVISRAGEPQERWRVASCAQVAA